MFVLNEEQYKEMRGDWDSNEESFYGFSDVDSASSSAEEDSLGSQEYFEGGRHQKVIRLECIAQRAGSKDFTEETGVKADLGDSPSELEMFSKVSIDEVFQLMVIETNRYARKQIKTL